MFTHDGWVKGAIRVCIHRLIVQFESGFNEIRPIKCKAFGSFLAAISSDEEECKDGGNYQQCNYNTADDAARARFGTRIHSGRYAGII